MMKKITYQLLLVLFCLGNSFAQKNNSFEKANYYLKEKGEVVLRFKATNVSQLEKINKILSIGHKHIDEIELEGEAYANTKEQLQRFISLGILYEVTKEDNEIPQEFTARVADSGTGLATNAWDTTWDAYPKYSEYVAKMQYWAATYPSLCTLQNIGTTVNGRTLYVLKISDNPTSDETEPEFFYTSSMHGDEITGYPTMLRFIDYLLTNYGSLSEVTNLLNGTELFINPLANPDGSYKAAGNDIYNPGPVALAATRANANGVDLNRNYADAIGGLHDDGNVYQPETIAFMNFQATRNFVLAANYHGGTEVVNFPLDTSNTPGTGAFSYHPHDNYFKFVSTEYAQLCQTADGNLNYMDAVYNSGQFPGTTNGAAWYSVYGGRQDASNYFDHSKEITIEISNAKTPAASSLPFFWDRNRQALLNFVKQASYGLHGVVSDANGNPIHAKVYVGGTVDNFGSWVETSPTKGDYHKVQIAGTYNVIFEAPGYVSQTISVTLTNFNTTTLNVTMVPTTSLPTASDATICEGQTATLNATGTGTIRWYDGATSTNLLASTASYTTPALTTTTSYWVEREVALANVGPATVTGSNSDNTALANRYLRFNCSTPTKLKSVTINNTAIGDILVELQNSTGVMLESKVIRLTTTGSKDIVLDFFLPAQNNLRLVSRELSGGGNLVRANSGITYPITSGNISIVGNSGTGIFFQFFNWKLEPIKSNREEVIVTVKPNPTITTISPTTRQAGLGAFTLTVNGTNFVNGESIVRWNGSNRTTTFVSSTQITAAITAADVLSSGTSSVTVFNTCNSTSTTAQSFIVSGGCASSTIWNGSGWSNGLPASDKSVTFTGSYSGVAITACDLSINSPANVTFSSGNATIGGAITVQSGATLTFNNNVNLIQTTEAVNSGNVIIKRNSNPLMRFDYIGWSSPVLNQGLLSYSPLTSINPTVRFYTFNSATNLYTSVGTPAINTATFDSGKGYLIRLPFDHPTAPTVWTGTFTGQPNNGAKSVALANHISDATKRFNLIGNPYPSTISIPAFASANSANIEPSIYFWRKTNNTLSPSYCSYNIVSGVYADNGEAYTENPNGVIQIGQGFLAQAKPGATEVVFANNQRIANNTNQTFRSSSLSSTSTNTENNNFWLNMTGAPTEFSQTVIGYHSNATQGIDDYDSVYFNDGAIAFTSIVDGQNLVIQGRVGPFNPADVVPMRYKVANSGTYSIVIDHAEGIFSSGSQSIYVKDNLLNTYHNLNTGAYTFTSTAGTFADRFEVVYQTALSNDVVDFTSNNVTLYNQNNILNINSGNTTMDTVKVFDIRGRLIIEKKNIVSSQVQINVPPTNQVLLVEITSIEGINVVKKVLN